MKLKKPIILILCLLSVLLLAVGCSTEANYDFTGMVQVTFHLEGGQYRNCEGLVNYYYDFKPGENKRIKNPAAEEKKNTVDGRFVDATVSREGYYLDGWYRTKVEEDGYTDYADVWNFETDTVSDDGIELYAKWVPIVKYTFAICAMDENSAPVVDDDGEYVVMGSYTVSEGDTFSGDILEYKDKRTGYTAIQGDDGAWYYNADGTPWDDAYTHPGGEKSTAIPVFVHYLKGKFEFVSTKEELLSYCKRAPWTNAFDPVGIYLRDDIDMGGDEFEGFRNFMGIFDGQGHTISDFTLKYDSIVDNYVYDNDIAQGSPQLHISLFGGLRNATVKDVAFENFTIDVVVSYANENSLVYVSPLCVKAISSNVSNVKITGAIKEVKFSDKLVSDNYYVAMSDDNTLLPIPKIAKDGNFRDSTFTDIDLSGMTYESL